MQSFIDSKLLERLRVGPLASYLDVYLMRIEQDGFLPSSVPCQAYAIARFSKWLQQEGIRLEDLDEIIVRRFLDRDPGVVHFPEPATIRRLVLILREMGVVKPEPPPSVTSVQQCVAQYRRYLVHQRGLAESCLPNYVSYVELFLSQRFAENEPCFMELRASDVTTFVKDEVGKLSPGRAKLLVTALRSFLRYLLHQAAPKRNTWLGRRDHALLLMAIQTGLRLSEITALRQQDVVLGKGAHVRCEGKGRKERCTPLTKSTVTTIAEWIREQGQHSTRILFPNARGGRLSADAVQYLVTKHGSVAQQTCSTLGSKRLTPHVLRHTAAMELLQAGVDRAVIALWLGHESVETTQIYLDAD